ncbi:DUF4825 domain-containing protein [Aquibacillus kalidii]|uniref:DUF4825 domain-containing protein n=1 Tax=Aquibacillus kalidii TaxID=2762597 RepID=UPI001645C712|nr:DUF4825 domain-containing protein [Aquibacillus kalidii]
MKHIVRLLLLLVVFLLVTGCNSSEEQDELFQLKGSNVGDNSAVANIVNQLKQSDHFEEMELKTKDEPYGIILQYNWQNSEQKFKETVIYNASFLFTLVENVDWIIFHIDTQEYKLTKEGLYDWYGTDLSEFTTKQDLVKLIEEKIEDEKSVNQLLSN